MEGNITINCASLHCKMIHGDNVSIQSLDTQSECGIHIDALYARNAELLSQRDICVDVSNGHCQVIYMHTYTYIHAYIHSFSTILHNIFL